MEHLSNDHKNCPNQHKNSHKQCDTSYPIVNIIESQWKLRQHDQNFQMEGKGIVEQILESEWNPKEQNCENHSLDLSSHSLGSKFSWETNFCHLWYHIHMGNTALDL